MIDLHSHTTASDGSLSPAQLVERAARVGVTALAITDHDTLDGLQEAMSSGVRFGVEIVPGLEISAEYSPGTMHILGYFIDLESIELQAQLKRLRVARDERNPQIIERLRALGIDISLEEVVKASGGEVVGRPHFARVMVEKGYVRSADEAFQKYLRKGAPAYAEKARLRPKLAVELIKNSGGVAVLAHPYQLRVDEAETARVVEELKEYGLDGLEVIYSRHNAHQVECYSRLALRYDLLITGGSDFHGLTKPDIELGIGLGGLCVPERLLDALKERACNGKVSG